MSSSTLWPFTNSLNPETPLTITFAVSGILLIVNDLRKYAPSVFPTQIHEASLKSGWVKSTATSPRLFIAGGVFCTNSIPPFPSFKSSNTLLYPLFKGKLPTAPTTGSSFPLSHNRASVFRNCTFSPTRCFTGE